MDKLTMAHDWAMKYGSPENFRLTVDEAWEYADRMQAEADKRIQEDGKKKREEVREMLKNPNTFVEREGQHFEDEPTIPNQHSSSEL